MATRLLPRTSSAVTTKTFADLKGDFFKDDIMVRLIHFWEARNFLKAGILIGLQLLFIDTQASTVQAFIPVTRIDQFEAGLKCNAIYKLRRFMVTLSKKVYQVSDHKYGVTFTNHTVLEEISKEGPPIDCQKFHIRPYSKFAEIVDTGTELYDIIGELTVVTGNQISDATPMCSILGSLPTASNDKVFLHLLMADGETMRVYLWDQVAADFRGVWNKASKKPKVLLLPGGNPKTFGGAVSLSSTPCTRLFFDDDVTETREFLSSLSDDGNTEATVASSSSAITKLETVTLNEIVQFISNELPQTASFIYVGTVQAVLKEQGWNYVSCTGCKTKVAKTETSLFCAKCRKSITVGLLRYRFEVSVRDTSGEATFVILDNEAAKIAGRSATEAFSEMTEGGENAGTDDPHMTIPDCLLDIVGHTCIQVSVTPYNFTATRKIITVSRILEYNYEEALEDLEPALVTYKRRDGGDPELGTQEVNEKCQGIEDSVEKRKGEDDLKTPTKNHSEKRPRRNGRMEPSRIVN